jgi:uncharacterized damage-inducible protein DinB
MVKTATSLQPVLGKMIRKYADYNTWTAKTLVNWLSTKENHFIDQAVPSSFPSIRASLVHISQTERFWLDVLRENPPTFFTNELDSVSASELFAHFQKQAEELSSYIETLSEEQLLEEVSLDTPWVKGSRPRYEFLLHVVNHTSYHRGQVITIGRNLGFTDAPMMDFNYFNMMPF